MASSTRPFFAETGSISIQQTDASDVDYTADVKEISISGGGRDVELVRTFGNNQVFDEKPMESFEVSLTIIKQDIDFAIMTLGGTGLNNTGSPGSAFEVYPHNAYNLRYELFDDTFSGGEMLKVKMFSAFATGKEMSLNSTDHLEETITFKVLPMNYREFYTADRAAGSIS